MSTHQRSHDGCWTCKARRRKCDRTRPTCRACHERGITCEGYEVRLRWGSGIASRGRFTGAGEPVVSSVPVRAKGRRRELNREKHRLLGSECCVSTGQKGSVVEVDGVDHGLSDSGRSSSSCPRTSGEGERLFQEFLSSGINVLHSTSIQDTRNLLAPRLPGLCQQSDALHAICLALQASISSESTSRFLEYFDTALNQFRTELARSVTRLEDGTFVAGLLLCSIGLVHGLPWTMHLHGMYSMLQSQGLDEDYRHESGFRSHLLEVMGVMDLPSFAIGRQNPSLGVWRRYCRNRGEHTPDDVEVVSGLPKSLLDIFSCIGEGATEEDFWDWPGMEGTLLQYQLWEAYRLAGILTVRHGQLHSNGASPSQPEQPSQYRRRALPQTKVIVSRILSSLAAISRGSMEPDGKDSLVINAIDYPVFVVGLQTEILNEDADLKQIVRRCFVLRRRRAEVEKDNQTLLGLLEEWWQSGHEMRSVHQLAQSRGLELGLV